jgi:regulator of protease activity HflC (stomatin/prohibitin superfamily)
MHLLKTGFAVGVAVVGLGCASAPPPTEQLASAEASMRAARELGATQVPRAQLHLRLAQEQVTQARKLAQDGENERAASLLNRAHADAELALALSREATIHRELESASPTQSSATTTPTNPTVSVVR